MTPTRRVAARFFGWLPGEDVAQELVAELVDDLDAAAGGAARFPGS
jgi:hypothetical protein